MAAAGFGFAVKERGAQLHKPSQQQPGVNQAGPRTLHPLWVCTTSKSRTPRIVKIGKTSKIMVPCPGCMLPPETPQCLRLWNCTSVSLTP